VNRRAVLKSAVSVGGGAGLVSMGRGALTEEAEARATAAPASFVEARDGTRLFYRDWGMGRPVVFVHGWAVGADMWEYQMTPLASRGLRCIAYDRRGCGRSGQMVRAMSETDFRPDVRAFTMPTPDEGPRKGAGAPHDHQRWSSDTPRTTEPVRADAGQRRRVADPR